MAVQGVAFRAPEPYPLPADFANHLKSQPEAEALRLVCQLLVDNHCAELAYVERLERDGHLRAAAAAGSDARGIEAAQDLLADSAREAYLLDSDAGRASMGGQAIQAGSGMLFMGEMEPDDPAIPYAAVRAYLMAGSGKGNLGFSYANPIVDAGGKAHGVLCLFRSLAAGPLNHDQPALVRALVLLLGENLANAPVI